MPKKSKELNIFCDFKEHLSVTYIFTLRALVMSSLLAYLERFEAFFYVDTLYASKLREPKSCDCGSSTHIILKERLKITIIKRFSKHIQNLLNALISKQAEHCVIQRNIAETELCMWLVDEVLLQWSQNPNYHELNSDGYIKYGTCSVI